MSVDMLLNSAVVECNTCCLSAHQRRAGGPVMQCDDFNSVFCARSEVTDHCRLLISIRDREQLSLSLLRTVVQHSVRGDHAIGTLPGDAHGG